MTTRSGSSSRSSVSTCSSCKHTSSSSLRYPARVASPSGGNSEYLIGRQKGLLASVSAGRIILTFIETPPQKSVWSSHSGCLSHQPRPPEWELQTLFILSDK